MNRMPCFNSKHIKTIEQNTLIYYKRIMLIFITEKTIMCLKTQSITQFY